MHGPRGTPSSSLPTRASSLPNAAAPTPAEKPLQERRAPSAAPAVTVSAEGLFDHLVEAHELISFNAASEAAFGPLSGVWRGYTSASKVLDWARRTSWRKVGDVQIGLDVLLVAEGARPERRAIGHTDRRQRTAPGQVDRRRSTRARDAWSEALGDWTMCRHELRRLRAD